MTGSIGAGAALPSRCAKQKAPVFFYEFRTWWLVGQRRNRSGEGVRVDCRGGVCPLVPFPPENFNKTVHAPSLVWGWQASLRDLPGKT